MIRVVKILIFEAGTYFVDNPVAKNKKYK